MFVKDKVMLGSRWTVGRLGNGTSRWALASLVGVVALVALVACVPEPPPPPPTSSTTTTTTVPPNAYRLVAAGPRHACAATYRDGVRCWGLNTAGQLGNGSTVGSSTPVKVVGLGRVRAISVNGFHSCVVTEPDGDVYCWGSNDQGQLGIGGPLTFRSTPQKVAGLTGVTSISAGYSSTCAVLATGVLKCWGDNSLAQLGNGSRTDSATPVTAIAINLAPGVTEVSVGWKHACAITTAGAARCWGGNDQGQLGLGSESDVWDYAQPVVGLSAGVTDISAGYEHTCAVVNGGGMCWGNSALGALGAGGTGYSRVPVAIAGSGVGPVTDISAGEDVTCAKSETRAAWCWGDNVYGALGTNSPPVGSWSSVPVRVLDLDGIVSSIDVGGPFACAATGSVFTDSAARCWGSNGWGTLGDGTGIDSYRPVAVLQT